MNEKGESSRLRSLSLSLSLPLTCTRMAAFFSFSPPAVRVLQQCSTTFVVGTDSSLFFLPPPIRPSTTAPHDDADAIVCFNYRVLLVFAVTNDRDLD